MLTYFFPYDPSHVACMALLAKLKVDAAAQAVFDGALEQRYLDYVPSMKDGVTIGADSFVVRRRIFMTTPRSVVAVLLLEPSDDSGLL